jgi:enamine deaminase RidA (YjgF/YER057c/UK114 family)
VAFSFVSCDAPVVGATTVVTGRPPMIDLSESEKRHLAQYRVFVEVFGDAGRHARSAVGNVMLPNQISVEIEGIIAVKP